MSSADPWLAFDAGRCGPWLVLPRVKDTFPRSRVLWDRCGCRV